jgi:hypothetical protein
VRRRAGWWLLLCLSAVLVVTGCGGGASPSPTAAPGDPMASMSPLSDDDLAVCDGTVRMVEGVGRLRAVRVRRGAADQLARALERVVEGQQLVLEYASGAMRTRVRSLGFAVANVTIAIEDLRTTDRYEAAATNVRRRITALRRAVESFRSWLGCPEAG